VGNHGIRGDIRIRMGGIHNHGWLQPHVCGHGGRIRMLGSRSEHNRMLGRDVHNGVHGGKVHGVHMDGMLQREMLRLLARRQLHVFQDDVHGIRIHSGDIRIRNDDHDVHGERGGHNHNHGRNNRGVRPRRKPQGREVPTKCSYCFV